MCETPNDSQTLPQTRNRRLQGAHQVQMEFGVVCEVLVLARSGLGVCWSAVVKKKHLEMESFLILHTAVWRKNLRLGIFHYDMP